MMANENMLRLYIEYDTLLLSDLCRLLSDIEGAYNKLDAFIYESQRVRRDHRLQVSAIRTGESIVVILLGDPLTLVSIGVLIERTIKARKLYWEGRKAKQDALDAEARSREAHIRESIESGIRAETPVIVGAIRLLRRAFDRFDRRGELVQLTIDAPEKHGPREGVGSGRRFNSRKTPYLFRDTMLKLIESTNVEYKELVRKSA
jgi:hypothetical protein